MAVEVELMLLAIPLFSGNGIWKMQPELDMCKMWGKKTKNPRRSYFTRVSSTRSRG